MLSTRAVGALIVMQNEGFTIGMLVAFRMFAGCVRPPPASTTTAQEALQEPSMGLKGKATMLFITHQVRGACRWTSCFPSGSAGRRRAWRWWRTDAARKRMKPHRLRNDMAAKEDTSMRRRASHQNRPVPNSELHNVAAGDSSVVTAAAL